MQHKNNHNVYNEAMRYIHNAEEILQTKANKNGMYYQDEKYCKMSCGTAYKGVLMAIKEYIKQKNITIERKPYQRIKIDNIKERLSELKDYEMQNHLKNAYNILHLSGYYDWTTSINLINDGIQIAKKIIEKIK